MNYTTLIFYVIDLENELRQTQNIEHIQHLNSVLRDQDELIVSLTDKVDMYKEMQRSTSADVVFWKNKYDIAYTEKEEEIRKLKIGLCTCVFFT
jgi:hypothetical protein